MALFQYYCDCPGKEEAASVCGYTGQKWDTMRRHLQTKHGISMKSHTTGNKEKSLQWRLQHCRDKNLMRAATDVVELPDCEQDATQAALEILISINPKERVNLNNTDAEAARCNDCGQTVMGITGRGFGRQDLADNIYCMGCCKEGMQSVHNLNELELQSFIKLLRNVPILGFCGSQEEAFRELSRTSPCITQRSSGLSCVEPEDVLQCIQGELKRQATLGQKKEGAGDWDPSGVKPDSPDIVRDTATAIRKRGRYLQAQLRSG
ncbi:hypothetical protein WJX77_007863 [Trebouxia sp. C0004]